uniref:IBB domain-containing protein n=1 Tax=Haemonchus placei TaxID=6290 RepID=A0A0N4X7H7_HAEPC
LYIMTNVFNTFSFNKWADSKKEEEIDKESKRRRTEQIKRLKERLRRERELRENGGNGDLDLEALIEALQCGEEINELQVDEEPKVHHPTSYAGRSYRCIEVFPILTLLTSNISFYLNFLAPSEGSARMY